MELYPETVTDRAAAAARAGRPTSRRRRPPRRRGVTSAMAMIFMVLIAMLAVAFYSMITTSTSVSQNDQKTARALVAAESGIPFMRLRLAKVKIPPTASTPAQVITEVHTDLRAAMEGTDNLRSNTVGLSNNVITIPAQAGAVITTDPSDKSGFSVVITSATPPRTGVVCTVTGHSGSGRTRRTKSVSLNFIRNEIPSTILQNAVAAKGTVNIMKGFIGGVTGVSPDSIASVMSAKTSSPAFTMSGGTLGGDVGVVDQDYALITGGTVHGQTNPTTIYQNHVQEVEPPEFPYIDTSGFASYATNTYVSGMTLLQNVRIPAGTGTTASPLTIAGSAAVQGILYIESPNVVHFGGNATIAGFIVFENKGTTSGNVLRFGGNATVSPLPPDAMFNPLRSITGIAIMAPTAAVTMTGSTDSYFKGNVIVGQFNEFGSATIKMDQGSIVTMDPGNSATFNGNTTRFASTGVLNPPSMGIRYSAKFIPKDGTYLELN